MTSAVSAFFSAKYFECPLSKQIMTDPVIDLEGHSYERASIMAWLKVRSVSPITQNPLRAQDLCPNNSLGAVIASWKKASSLFGFTRRVLFWFLLQYFVLAMTSDGSQSRVLLLVTVAIFSNFFLVEATDFLFTTEAPGAASFACPLSHRVLVNPTVDPEGDSYEERPLLDWLRKTRTSARTGKPLDVGRLRLFRQRNDSKARTRVEYADVVGVPLRMNHALHAALKARKAQLKVFYVIRLLRICFALLAKAIVSAELFRSQDTASEEFESVRFYSGLLIVCAVNVFHVERCLSPYIIPLLTLKSEE